MFDQGDFTGEVPSFNERFGAGLAAGDFDGDGVDDAAIGALWETVEVPGPDVQGAGSIHLLYGEAGIGLGTSGNDSYDVSDLDIPGEPLHREFFGYELEAGDFDGDGRDDLAVSAPGELHSGITGGGVFVLFGGSGSGYLTRIEFAETPQTWTEGNTAIVLTLERIGNRVYPLSVSYNDAAAGTASAGSDYQSLGGVLTWGAGDSTPRQITVNLLEDFLDEPSETIVLDITPESGVGVDDGDSLTLTILDDDAQPAVQHADGCRIVAESIGTVNLTVTRSGGANGGVTVDYATSNGTASAPSDYTAENGTLTFGFNDNAENIGIAVASDAGDEAPLESFRVTLSNPGGGAVLGTPTVVTVWVRDDDGPTLIFASNFECGDAADWSLDVP
jgi:hypothetical protein